MALGFDRMTNDVLSNVMEQLKNEMKARINARANCLSLEVFGDDDPIMRVIDDESDNMVDEMDEIFHRFNELLKQIES